MKKLFLSIILCFILISTASVWAQSHNMPGMSDVEMQNITQPPDVHDSTEIHDSSGDVNWYVISGFLGTIAIAGIFVARSDKWKKNNLLNVKLIKSLLKSRWYPLIFVLPTTIIFIVLLSQLFFGNPESSNNFGSVMVWILLWPVLPILYFMFGRLWCSICPLSRVSDEVQKKVGLHKKVPKLLQQYGVWLMLIIFLTVTWADVTIGIVESPLNTGYMLLFILGGVVLMGAVFERRSWCRYVCFLGGLSSNYSMSSALELRTDKEKCNKCNTPTCYKGDGKVDGCTMFEYPRTMESNRFCNFCSNCIKLCPHDSVRISLRVPTSELWFIKKPRIEEAILASILIGLVVVQTIVMLEVWEPFMTWFESSTSITNFTVGWTLIYSGAILTPIILMLTASFISTRFIEIKDKSKGVNRKYGKTITGFIQYSYALIPLGLAIHLAHNLRHLLGEGYSIGYTTASLFGLNVSGSLEILNMSTIQLIQYILSIFGVLGAVYTVVMISKNHSQSKSVTIPYIILILIFGIISLWLYSVPMSSRGH